MNRHDQVVYLAAAWCLSYPDEDLVQRVPLVRAALSEFPGALPAFAPVLDLLEATPPMELQAQYVREFDLGRRHALHLSYWTDGDTRRRGEVLGFFKEAYRHSGALVDLDGELPDYLPMVLEFAARVDSAAGRTLLKRYRASLEMLRLGLLRDNLPHATMLAAICATLPGKSPQDEKEVMRMAGYGPPSESVGLDPYDPRLLPVRRA
ncbi:nitrate reductase molybdenum cofactor assembly chaperone [Arthrobacter sp. FW306-05-C]|uniref:nitrate reductase molybdenum cofactor assembly chaperone n=1 Tax=Arthrobacter TaxID=1663 RepID=UPI001EF032F0|nr:MULTISPECIES: nitrate reductase molybdenum cofactor assembly chaperone [Arthrobacter]MDP9986302.1 nitrate reductase delta subunit [Arthrobacter oryzae]UKA65762.1 nitrate reductase molybdenum cofactor assembly chaperone [Arthrobacter sp. FW306-05-C]UKA70126.1 nitrate reductase molybdenum cofactor assembly chaperone [Arthrobacter sp. FW306-06-A]UKA74425.1 nitrate reductase molybdenum cofactor assembly chaperone [Arthrobacter sp. FW306-07-I]